MKARWKNFKIFFKGNLSPLPLKSFGLTLVAALTCMPDAKAAWSLVRCKIQCTKTTCSKDLKRLTNCTQNCRPQDIDSCLSAQFNGAVKAVPDQPGQNSGLAHEQDLERRARQGDLVAKAELGNRKRRAEMVQAEENEPYQQVD